MTNVIGFDPNVIGFDPVVLNLAKTCAVTYQAEAKPTWENSAKSVHVFLSELDSVPVIAWEGTSDFQEWLIDFMAIELPMFDHIALGPVHLGFMIDVLAVHDTIIGWLKTNNWPKYYNTGHSKGAGEALLFHGIMKTIGHPPLMTAAFESPKVGSSVMRDYLAGENIIQTATRNAHGVDIVTQVPFGPTWTDVSDPIALLVSDGLDLMEKHRIAAVITAIKELT